MQFGTTVVELDGIWNLVCVLGVIWLLNLFNFMDGIDGIAASEAIFVLLVGGLLSLSLGISSGIGLGAGVVAGSCIGFLDVELGRPAKIFMGDVGSGYLGYVIAVLVLAAAAEHPVMIPVWLVLGALFFVDAHSNVNTSCRAWRASIRSTSKPTHTSGLRVAGAVIVG